MTAKQELRKLVDSLDEWQAEKCLDVVRAQLKNGAEHPLPDELPARSELLKMDLAARRAILRRFPAEVDMEQAREWGKVGAEAVEAAIGERPSEYDKARQDFLAIPPQRLRHAGERFPTREEVHDRSLR